MASSQAEDERETPLLQRESESERERERFHGSGKQKVKNKGIANQLCIKCCYVHYMNNPREGIVRVCASVCVCVPVCLSTRVCGYAYVNEYFYLFLQYGGVLTHTHKHTHMYAQTRRHTHGHACKREKKLCSPWPRKG